jgi:hypothetical protein
MIPPCFVLVGVGAKRLIWIPVPLILLWPFWLFGWAVWAFAWMLRVEREHDLRMGLTLLAQLTGLRMDVDTTDGTHIHLRFV